MRESNYKQVISHVYKNEGEEVADWNVLCRSWRELSKKPFVPNRTLGWQISGNQLLCFTCGALDLLLRVVLPLEQLVRRPRVPEGAQYA